MKIRKLRVKNFRSIKFIDLDMHKEKQLLVGQNNSGKSNLLRAIDCVFNNRYTANENDIYVHKKEDDITVIDIMLSSTNVDNNFSNEWLPLFSADITKNEYGEDSYSIRCVIKENENTGRFDIERFPIMNWDSSETEPKGKSLPRLIRKCMPSFHVTSGRDIISELRIKSSNFSQLLRNSNFNLKNEDKREIENKLSEVNTLISSKLPDLSQIELKLSQISTTLKHVQSVNILPIPNKLSDLDKGVEILVKENDKHLPIEIYGDGTRSWISILSLKSFVELQKYQNNLEGLPFFPILLIEEPESHLHPHAQKKVITQLVDIQAEIFVTTHSTDILSSVNDFQVIRIFKEGKETKLAMIEDEDLDADLDYKFKNQIILYNTNVFFSEKTILVEGISDKVFLENYYLFKYNKKLVDVGVSVIETRGFGSLGLFRKFCEKFKIDNVILADLDAKSDVDSSIEKYDLSANKIHYTINEELEDDILSENFDVVLEMFKEEENKPEQYIDNLKDTNRLKEKLLKYLKDGKTEYPYLIKKYFNNEFKMQVIDKLLEELEV